MGHCLLSMATALLSSPRLLLPTQDWPVDILSKHRRGSSSSCRFMGSLLSDAGRGLQALLLFEDLKLKKEKTRHASRRGWGERRDEQKKRRQDMAVG